MKRKEATKNGWKIIFGLHKTAGPFVYVWKEDEPQAQLCIDAHGVRGVPSMDKRFNAFVEEILDRLRLLGGRKYSLACGDVMEVFNRIDPQWAKEMTSDVYNTCSFN
jgi:hypothetical protein